jgi:hypothetical protein
LGLGIYEFDALIDMCCDAAHDGFWRSPFALVLALDPLPKDNGLEVLLRDWFGIE